MNKKMPIENLTIRPIEEKDNAVMAKVIRDTLTEFGANRPGTVYYDESTDALFQLFSNTPRSLYYVAEINGEVAGGGGLFPSPGLPEDTCELVKMYLLSSARGKGLGKLMIEKIINEAKQLGYKNIYLETMPELKQALKTYEKFGFEYLNGPMGNTGHHGCEKWMIRSV
jgi:putative acetyltransferase